MKGTLHADWDAPFETSLVRVELDNGTMVTVQGNSVKVGDKIVYLDGEFPESEFRLNIAEFFGLPALERISLVNMMEIELLSRDWVADDADTLYHLDEVRQAIHNYRSGRLTEKDAGLFLGRKRALED